MVYFSCYNFRVFKITRRLQMKKTLLLSVAASALIMAGGDIAPVEPAVAAPAPSGWDFSGQAVFYYNTMSMYGIDLFDQELAASYNFV